MPQPNQGKPAPSAPTSEPIMDKSGAMNADTIAKPIVSTGTRGK